MIYKNKLVYNSLKKRKNILIIAPIAIVKNKTKQKQNNKNLN